MAPTLIPTISTESVTYRRLLDVERRKFHKLSALLSMLLIVNKMIGTGIFLTPSIIFQYCGGDTKLFISLWVIGGIIIFSGLFIFLEFALNLPFKNGGEKNYLLRSFASPKGLAGCVYAFQMVILGFSSGNSFAFGKYVLYAAGYELQLDSDWWVKLVGVACITGCIWVHIRYPSQGTQLFNFLGVFKILILVLIIICGGAAALGWIKLDGSGNSSSGHHDLQKMASDAPAGSYSIAIALLEIVYSFKGWENANYVLLEVADPYTVLTLAAPLAVLITVVLYILVVFAYLIVIPKVELMESGVLVAGIFFTKIFGKSATSTILPILIALSNLGNVLVVSFAHGHVNQELALSNYLPFSKYFTNLNHSLVLHWFVTVLVLVAPPSLAIYEFVVNLYVYPGTWVNVFLTIGLFRLKWNAEANQWGNFNTIDHSTDFAVDPVDLPAIIDEDMVSIDSEGNGDSEVRPFVVEEQTYTDFDSILEPPKRRVFSAPYAFLLIFLAANLFLALFPFIPPPSDSLAAMLPIPFWCFPTLGTGVLLLGGCWFFARQHWHLKHGLPPPIYEENL